MPPVPQPPARPRVLVAEDNPISCLLLSHQLRRLGCDVEACSDGRAAIDAWRAGRFDLVITDLQMPSLDGFELAALIRSEAAASRVPIIALTAGAPGDEAARCEAAGIDGCLAKPASNAALRETLECRLVSA